MATGLCIPVGVDSSGGASLCTGDDNDIKVIKAALNSGDNENAFQQNITLGEDMIFGMSDPLIRSRITVKIRQIFEVFYEQHRFKLLVDTIKWTDEAEVVNLTFRYLNLESDEEKEYSDTFTAVSTGQISGIAT